MKRICFLVGLLALGLASGCVCNFAPIKANEEGRYQLLSDGQGRFAKLDTQTGQVICSTEANWTAPAEKPCEK